MNEKLWTQATIQRVLVVEGDDWRQRIADIMADATRLFAEGLISADAYEAVEEARNGRLERTATSKGRHEDRKTSLSGLSKTIGSGMRVVPMVDQSRPAPPSPSAVVPKIKTGVRGPSRHTSEERAERIRYLRRQADMAKLPADLSAEYSRGELSVISNVLFVIHESAAGACELALEAVAARARVSKRCVQDALSIAKRLGHLLVQRQGRKPSRITVLLPRIQKWLNGPDATLLMEKIEELLETIKSPSHVADICHSDSTDPTQDAQQGQESVPARVGADLAPRPRMGVKTHSGAVRQAWNEMLDRANALVAAAARSRVARDDPAPS